MRRFYQMWLFLGSVVVSSALPFTGCIGGGGTGAISQALTDDGGVDGSSPVVDMAAAAPDLALAPIPPGARIRPRIPVSESVAINAPLGLWDSKFNTACEPMQTIDGRVRCIPKNVFPNDIYGPIYYYDANCTRPFAFVRKVHYPYSECRSTTMIGSWTIRMKPRGLSACGERAVRPVMFAMTVTGEEPVPLAPLSAKYYQFSADAGGPPLGSCWPVYIQPDYDKEYLIMRMAGYEVSEFAEMSELH